MINIPLLRDNVETVISFVGEIMPHRCVVVWMMMFCKIVRFVSFSLFPVNKEVSLDCLIPEPIEYHVHWFEFLCLKIELMMTKAVKLEFSIDVGGCWRLSSYSVVRSGIVVCTWWMSPPSANVTTWWSTWNLVWSGPFFTGFLGCSPDSAEWHATSL